MLLNWKEGRLLGLTVPGNGVPVAMLKPGINEVPDKVWGEVQKSKSIKRKLKEGTLTMVQGTVKEETKKGPGGRDTNDVTTTVTSKTLKDLPAEEAVEVVRNTLDVDLLESWKVGPKAEARDEVRAAIANQIEKMSK